MPIYDVTQIEIVAGTYRVEADSAEEARTKLHDLNCRHMGDRLVDVLDSSLSQVEEVERSAED